MARSLSEYYATNYSKCPLEESFLASWQGLAYTSHAIQFFALPIQIFTFYLILKKTPDTMESVKWPLLITHFACTLVDMEFCTLSTPYFFFPSFACFGVGLLNFFEVSVLFQLILGAILTLGMSISIIYLFETRSGSIPGNRFRIENPSTKMFYYLYHCLFASTFFLLLINIPEDQEVAKLQALDLVPCPTKEFFEVPLYVPVSDPIWISLFFRVIGPIIVIHTIAHIFFHSGCCMYYLFFSQSKKTSHRTRKIQRKFFIGILTQTGVPFTVLFVPYFIYTIFLINDSATQTMTNLLIITFGLHGIAESITLIFVHNSYREVIWTFLGIKTKKNTSRNISEVGAAYLRKQSFW